METNMPHHCVDIRIPPLIRNRPWAQDRKCRCGPWKIPDTATTRCRPSRIIIGEVCCPGRNGGKDRPPSATDRYGCPNPLWWNCMISGTWLRMPSLSGSRQPAGYCNWIKHLKGKRVGWWSCQEDPFYQDPNIARNSCPGDKYLEAMKEYLP